MAISTRVPPDKRRPAPVPRAATSVEDIPRFALADLSGPALDGLLDELPLLFWAQGEDRTIVHTNRKFRETYGVGLGQACYRCVMERETVCDCCKSDRVLARNRSEECRGCVQEGGRQAWQVRHHPVTRDDGARFVFKFGIDYSKWQSPDTPCQREFHPPDNRSELFWLMCASCKKIKHADDEWVGVETYLIDRFNLSISHGICPACMREIYPGIKA
jgi:hypothetical protein